MINYFFSKWIVNLGVVPLLLFAAFLLLPILTFLFDLLNFVTLVFETIFQLHKIRIFTPVSNFRSKFLPILRCAVKTIVLTVTLCPTASIAKDTQTIDKTTILLSIGEHREIKYLSMSKFTITNPMVIGHKHKKKSSLIIIKGLKLGYTEVVLWTKKMKHTFQVFVLEKRRQLKILHIAETLKEMGLKIQLAGPLIIASGEVSDLKNYSYLKELVKQNTKKLILKVIINKTLRNTIFITVYERFFNAYEDFITCKAILLDINCSISKHIPPKFYKDLENQYSIKFIRSLSNKQKNNYLLKINFFKLSTTDSENFSKGLSKLSNNINNLIDHNWASLIKHNRFELNGNHFFLQSIGRHDLTLTLDELSRLKLGSETSFSSLNNPNKTSSTSWKFSGFNISCKLKAIGEKYHLKYKIQFSKPTTSNKSNFSNSTNESSVFLTLNKSLNIFTSNSTHIGTEEQLLPYISKFPILGSLFKDNKKISLTERILAYVKLEHH
jgi:hypothetical protein